VRAESDCVWSCRTPGTIHGLWVRCGMGGWATNEQDGIDGYGGRRPAAVDHRCGILCTGSRCQAPLRCHLLAPLAESSSGVGWARWDGARVRALEWARDLYLQDPQPEHPDAMLPMPCSGLNLTGPVEVGGR
jgi:hypothetical protein